MKKEGTPKIYSYIVTNDMGFAPNPYHGYCTLACCKPDLRRTAKKGDWIIGLSGKKKGFELIYIMTITKEPIRFVDYYHDYKRKRPSSQFAIGDNIYKPIKNNPQYVSDYKQLQSEHSKGKDENMDTKIHDLGNKLQNDRVLISDDFIYYGINKRIFKELDFIIRDIFRNSCRRHRVNDQPEEIAKIESFFRKLSLSGKGRKGTPSDKVNGKYLKRKQCRGA